MTVKKATREWFVAVQVNATSLIDEGVDSVLDLFQEAAAANVVMLSVHGFNPEVIDRPATHSGHGLKGPHGSAGGTFAIPNPEHYRGLPLGDARVKDPLFEGFDALAETHRAAKARGMSLHLYILESASTGGQQRTIAGWPRLLEIDVLGRRSRLPCINNPVYRDWKLALVEDLYKSYEFDGLLWGVERWGPLHVSLTGGVASCFCSHCGSIAREAGLDWKRAVGGYRALGQAMADWRGGRPGTQTTFVEFLRIILAYPEILAWEKLWTERYLSLHREIFGVAKWLGPERTFGLGLWHYYFINPLLRAEWDLQEFARSADYIRPILYHVPEGIRIKHFLEALGDGAFRAFAKDGLLEAFSGMLDMRLPSYREVVSRGLSADFVAAGVEVVRREVGRKMPIYAGIGLDVRQHGHRRAMRPEDATAAVAAAARAGADGVVASRNYAEMRIGNLKAFGNAVRHRR